MCQQCFLEKVVSLNWAKTFQLKNESNYYNKDTKNIGVMGILEKHGRKYYRCIEPYQKSIIGFGKIVNA